MNAFLPRGVKPLDPRPARGGWAPGEYLAYCITCGATFAGDKRACTCADCAYAAAPHPSPEYLAKNHAKFTPQGGYTITIAD